MAMRWPLVLLFANFAAASIGPFSRFFNGEDSKPIVDGSDQDDHPWSPTSWVKSLQEASKKDKKKKKKGGGAVVKVPPYCDKYTSLSWQGNNSLRYSNLGGQGPDSWAAQGIQFANVLPHSGIPLEATITTLGAYIAHPEIPNHVYKEFLSIGVSSGSSTTLRWDLLDAVTGAPAEQSGVYLTFANFVGEQGGEGPKWAVLCGYEKFMLSKGVESNIKTKRLNETCIKVTSTTTGREWNLDDKINVRAMNDKQQQDAFSVLFESVTTIRMELGTSAGPKGVQFLIAGQSNLPCPTRAMCNTYKCPKFFQLVEHPESEYCAASECEDVPDRNYCCVPEVMEECEPAETLLMAPGALLFSNLAGKGPDTMEDAAMVFRDVFPASGKSVNLQIKALSSYTPANTSWNGQYGSYGSINVQEGTSVDLEFAFVKAKKGKPYKVEHSFIFSILDFDSQWDGGGAEKVMVDGFEEYYVTDNTKVNIGKDQRNRTVFKATVGGTELDNPDDPMNLTEEALDKSVSLLIPPTSSFTITVGVSPGWPGSGRNFMFAGWTTTPCPVSALCIYMTCPTGMTHKEDAANLMCQEETCSEEVDTTTCCKPEILELCDRMHRMPFFPNTVMNNNLFGRGPSAGTQTFITFSDVFPWGEVAADLDIYAMSEYTPVNVSENGVDVSGYAVINVKSGTSVELQFRFRDRKPHLSVGKHMFTLAFYAVNMEPGGGGAKTISVSGNILPDFIHGGDSVKLEQFDDRVQITAQEVGDDDHDRPRLAPEMLPHEQLMRSASVSFDDYSLGAIVKLSVSPGSAKGHNFYIGGAPILPCPESPDMCSTFACPVRYKLIKQAHETPCMKHHCTQELDLNTCCEHDEYDQDHCGHEHTLSLARENVLHNTLGHSVDDPKLVFGNVFPNREETIDLVVTNLTPYKAQPELLSENGIEDSLGKIVLEPNSNTEFLFQLFDRATGGLLNASYEYWFTFVNLATDNDGSSRQTVHLPSKYDILDHRMALQSFLDMSGQDTWVAMAPFNEVNIPVMSPFAMCETCKLSSVAFLLDKPQFRIRLSVPNGTRPMPFKFAGCTSLTCPGRQLCADHICPAGFEPKPNISHRLCKEARCGHEEDNQNCCQYIACNPPFMMSFSEASTVVSNLGGKGPDQGEEMVKFTNVFPWSNSSVDLEVTVDGAYWPNNNTKNGLNGEFGNINLKAGASSSFRLKFFKGNTTELWTAPPFFFSVFDMDQGRMGAIERIMVQGYTWFKVGGISEVRPKEPNTLEDPKEELNDTISFQSSTWGVEMDNPQHPLALSARQLNRTVTWMMPSISEFVMTYTVSPGLGGRNFLFGGASMLTCKAKQLCSNHKCPSNLQLRADASMHVCAGDFCTHEDNDKCCEARIVAHGLNFVTKNRNAKHHNTSQGVH